MKATQIVQELDDLDIDLGILGNDLILTGNTDALPARLRSVLAENKPKFLTELRAYRCRPDESNGSDESCYFYLASHGQQRLSFLDALHPQSSAYIVSASVFFQGDIDGEHLVKCLKQVAFQQDAIFSYLVRTETCDLTAVDRRLQIQLPILDLSDHPDPDAVVLPLRDTISKTPFDLKNPPLWRAALVKLSDEKFELIVAIHHYISDGWSLVAAFRQLAQVYGQPDALPSVQKSGARYQQFARQQRRRMLQPDVPRALAAAKASLDGCSLASDWFDCRPRLPVASDAAGRATFSLDAAQAGELRALASRHSLTISSLLASVFALTLHRFGDADRFAIGIAASNRPESRFENSFGFFVNWLAVPVDLRDQSQNFVRFVEQFHAQKLAAVDRIFLPFEEVVKHCQSERQPHLHPLFQYMFVSHVPARRISLAGMDITLLPLPNGSAKLDLTMFMTDSRMALAVDGEGDLFLELEYNVELFSQEMIDRFIGSYQEILGQVVVKADAPMAEMIGAVPSIVQGEQRSCPDTVLTLLDQAVERHGREVAIECDGESWTYDQLRRRAAQIAEQLGEDGASGQPVCILAKRGFDQIAAIIGTLAAGAAFTTLDVNAPQARNQRILDDAGPKVLLVSDMCALAGFSLQPGQFVAVLGKYGLGQKNDRENLAGVAIAGDHPAYNFYTSGSTGAPKGVTVSHQAFANFADWMGRTLGLTAADRVLAKTPVSFDAFLRETLASLCCGCRIVMANDDDALDIEKLVLMIKDHAVTVLHATPTIYAAILGSASQNAGQPLQTLTRVMCGGEAFSPRVCELHFALLPSCRVFNVYGPTECTVDVTCKELKKDKGVTISLGRPIQNCAIAVVDASLRPVEQGRIGEIVITGTPVGLGYRSAELLGETPFFLGTFGGLSTRAYRTGDSGRISQSGELHYCGRTDRQIKVRGMRIEPGEVEAVIEAHPGVAKAVVFALPGVESDLRLIAAVQPAADSGGGSDDLVARLQNHCTRSLPPAMIPVHYLLVDDFPRTAHGKLDQRCLVEMAERQAFAPAKMLTLSAADPLESEIITMASELLDGRTIGPHDNFFAIGGHSLSAVRLLSRVNKRFGTALTVKDLFSEPTVAALAALIGQGSASAEKPAIAPLRRSRRAFN